LWVLSVGLEGWYKGRLNAAQRFAAIVAAVLILLPPVIIAGLSGYLWNLAGFIIAAVLLGPRVKRMRRGPDAQSPEGSAT